MDMPYRKIVSFDQRVQMHEKLYNLFGEHGIGIDFVNSMSESINRMKNTEYLSMFIHANNSEVVSPIEAIRSLSTMPILVVSDKYDGNLKMNSINAGADEYFKEPANLQEGMASFFAQVRGRQYGEQKDKQNTLHAEDIIMNLDQHKVFVKDKRISMPKSEFMFLKLLMENPCLVLSCDEIYERLFQTDGRAVDSSNAVHQLVKKLRKKIQIEDTPQFIRTVHNVGYSFDPIKE